ncbi:hypothetical protein BDM02DRAFT_3261568 [Thelephora ganbajun]|uniref:Uncharacterized protein n=1 Tax=Thelephora ganbajun TaxID=370292 RepID=A0ACB6ZDK8_THEGA|nr:hypothetical protein BDM02DRAFT_3261568 [Thelephora ganbajun]
MTAWVTPVSVLRVSARVELWSWATRSAPLSFARNSTISTPYAETIPMVALREYPVPKTQLDSSIFEVSEEDEYRSVAESFKHSIAATTPVATNSSGFSSSSLLQLVRQRDYVSANRVRTEMIQHHLPITPDHAFIWPAMSAANSSVDPAVRLKEFSEWLSLLPVADEGTKQRPMFGRLMHSLNNNPQADINLVMAFVRICVSKGYMVKIPDQMIPLVVRFAPPSVSLRFLEELRSSVVENFTLDKQMKRKIRFWCKTAMGEYLSIGLIEEATKAFQIGLEYGSSLPRVSSRWLGKAVTKDLDRFGLSEEAIAALKRPKTRLPYYKEPSRHPGLVSDIPSAFTPLGFDTDPSDPKALLSRVWDNTLSVKPSDPLDVARFLEIFDPQPITIQFLSTRNQRKPVRYRGQWILGEMLYYARRKEWRELIGAFDTYFFQAGVPANIDKYKSRGRVTALNVQQRLFPSPYHTSLVWMATVEILQGGRSVSMLFKELVKQAKASKTRKYAEVGPSLVSASTEMFDAGHFSPFLVATYRKRRYKHLVVTFGKMHRLGIEPGAEQLSLLAGAYAGMAQGHEAVRTLERIEDVLKEEDTDRSSRPHHDISRGVALYMPALRGFVSTQDTLGASLVEQRILDHGYVKGTSPYVDRMLVKLETPVGVAS